MSETNGNEERPVLVVTGAAGFVGHALLRELRKPDAALRPKEIRVFDRKPKSALAPEYAQGVRYIEGDVRSYDQLLDAFRGADAVIHLAAIVDWGQTPERLLEAVNVRGAENAARAAADAGVRALVATSSTNVVWNGEPIRMADETLPYPKKFRGGYARTKALGEQAILRANGTPLAGREGERLRTCTLRPGGIYGDRDPYETNQILKMARLGGLAFRMGDGSAVFQNVYVGNVAHLHLLAARELLRGNDKVAGQTYYAVDHPARNLIDFFEPVIRGYGCYLAPRSRYLPVPLLMGVGAAMEAAAAAIRPVARFAPAVTRTSIALACRDYSFSGAKAERDLGYKPIYSEEEALSRTLAWFKEHGTT